MIPRDLMELVVRQLFDLARAGVVSYRFDPSRGTVFRLGSVGSIPPQQSSRRKGGAR